MAQRFWRCYLRRGAFRTASLPQRRNISSPRGSLPWEQGRAVPEGKPGRSIRQAPRRRVRKGLLRKSFPALGPLSSKEHCCGSTMQIDSRNPAAAQEARKTEGSLIGSADKSRKRNRGKRERRRSQASRAMSFRASARQALSPVPGISQPAIDVPLAHGLDRPGAGNSPVWQGPANKRLAQRGIGCGDKA